MNKCCLLENQLVDKCQLSAKSGDGYQFGLE